jgi:hypothetical protein
MPAAERFHSAVDDPVAGRVQLGGLYMDQPESDTLTVLIHGLGGDCFRPYIRNAARATVVSGLSALCLSMRGSDGSGEDIFHGGLTEDIRAALASPQLARYRRASAHRRNASDRTHAADPRHDRSGVHD